MPETSEQAAVVCVGILVADIFVQPMPRLPAAGELFATEDFLIDTGGCAANTATTLVRLGVSAAAVGKVGNDHFAGFIQDDLIRKGVNTSNISHSGRVGTSKTVILPVIGEDRRYIHTFGANAEFEAADIDLSLVENARVLSVGGYLVLPKLDQAALGALFADAKRSGVQTLLDVIVPAEQPPHDLRALEAILPHVDYFTPNDREAEVLTGETDPYKQAQTFLDAGCGAAIITMGERGTFFMNRDEHFFTPAFPIEMVDASGSGDAFAGGLIAGLLEGWPPREAVRFASAIGASACTKLGCTAGVFTRAQAEAFLAQHVTHP